MTSGLGQFQTISYHTYGDLKTSGFFWVFGDFQLFMLITTVANVSEEINDAPSAKRLFLNAVHKIPYDMERTLVAFDEKNRIF